MKMTYTPFFNKMAGLFNITPPLNFTTLTKLASTIAVDRYLGRSLPHAFSQ